MKRALITLVGLPLLVGSLSCATPLSTREKGAGIGALGGAAAGGIIGSAVRHPAAGALIGDQLQGQEQKQQEQDRQIQQNQAELERQRKEVERLKKQSEY